MFCPNCGQKNDDDRKFCMKCGKSFEQENQKLDQNTNSSGEFIGENINNTMNTGFPYIIMPAPVKADNCIYSNGSKVIRLVIGIISIVLSVVISIQSFASGIVNIFENPDGIDGTAGLLLSILMLAAGIISIAARKTRGGIITAASFYMLGAVIASIDVKVFTDLAIWSYVAMVFTVLLIISLALKKDPANYKRYSLDVRILSIIAWILFAGSFSILFFVVLIVLLISGLG